MAASSPPPSDDGRRDRRVAEVRDGGSQAEKLVVAPATRRAWDALQQVFGARGQAAKCQCQRPVLPMREYWHLPTDLRRDFLRDELRRRSAHAPGLVASLDREPVGWCRLGPRSGYPPLRNSPVPWAGREEDPDDPAVWAVVCFVVRTGYRKQGISQALAQAAIEYARDQGATALEGYPMETRGCEIPWGELHVGARGAFERAGFRAVAHPTARRYVMRVDF